MLVCMTRHLSRALRDTSCYQSSEVKVTHFVKITLSSASRMSGDEETESKVVTEGQASVFTPKSVFYNPVQEFNRDLTIAVLSEFVKEHFETAKERKEKNRRKNAYLSKCKTQEDSKDASVDAGKTDSPDDVEMEDDTADLSLKAGEPHPDGVRILEGLAASGLRSIRFGLEIPGVKEVVANDFDRNAVEFINKNIAKNGLKNLVRSNHGDAAMVMYEHKSFSDRFDVIDLDPYGSPSVFLDSAVQAVRDGGLLCITCTDLAVLCGNAGETCYSKYGAMSLKIKCCHEMALRIVLQAIESAANRYSRYIVPVISLSVDFYARVFVKVYTGQAVVKHSVSKLAYVYHCTGCGSFVLQKLANKVPTKGGNFKFVPSVAPSAEKVCEHCGSKQHIGGPIWADPIHDWKFIAKVLKYVEEHRTLFRTSERIMGMLSVIEEELPDVPLHYITDELCNIVHCTAPSIVQFRSALMNAGYRASMVHSAKNAHKTDAPTSVVWDIIRAWVKEHPVKASHLREGTPAKAILEQEPVTDVSFTPHPDANPRSRELGLLRWQTNPERDWGPKPRARKNDSETVSEKRAKGQQKYRERQKNLEHLKQHPCKKFKVGECDLGDECCYSHIQPTDSVTEKT